MPLPGTELFSFRGDPDSNQVQNSYSINYHSTGVPLPGTIQECPCKGGTKQLQYKLLEVPLQGKEQLLLSGVPLPGTKQLQYKLSGVSLPGTEKIESGLSLPGTKQLQYK